MRTKSIPRTEAKIPTDLRRALATSAKVQTLWRDLTPIARRDFISWIQSAKQLETRKRRVDRVGSMLLSGKRRPCCYAIVPMNFYKALNNSPKAKATWGTLTPTERRDFIAWVDSVQASDARQIRIAKACAMLASGTRRP